MSTAEAFPQPSAAQDDPVLECLSFLARRYDRPSSPVVLSAGLALTDTGRLPFHQIEAALEHVGLRTEAIRRPFLRRWRPSATPAVLQLSDDHAVVLLDVKDKQGRTPMTFAEGVFLAVQPPVRKPSTIALLQKLMEPR